MTSDARPWRRFVARNLQALEQKVDALGERLEG